MSVESQQRENAASKFGLLRRLSHSGSKNIPATVSAVGKTTPDVVEQAKDATALTVPAKAKVTTLTKLKVQLGRRAKNSKDKFPPSSWNMEPSASNASSPSDAAPAQEPTPEEITEPTPAENTPVEDPSVSPNNESGQVTDGASVEQSQISQMGIANADDSPSMSAKTLARRIHSLLSSVTPFYALSSSGSFRFPKASPDHSESVQDTGVALADSRLLALLSSATTMNGSISRGRESVWSILERLRYSPETQGKAPDEDGATDRDIDAETSSVMICCPLEPTEDTEVEIARSEVVSIDIGNEESPPEKAAAKDQKLGNNIWTFRRGKGKEETPSEPPVPLPRVKELRVWIPSRTKVSLQAAWWGYRIYLPPPVMRILDDKSLEAAKRAAMITAVLSWLVSHIPTTMLPPQLRAAVSIVKGIVPIVGYVGGFIAWSWNTIQSFDKGQGVILSATWLLPIALLPGTWDYVPPNNSPVCGSVSAAIPPIPPPKDSRLSIRPGGPV